MAFTCSNSDKIVMFLVLFLAVFSPAFGDTPANCTYEDIRGTWVFSLGSGGNDRSLNCSNFAGPVQSKVEITLDFPDVAVDQYGNMGFWTIIYNQGFEVVVAGRKYFAFSKYVKNGKQVTSLCNEIMPGWSHDTLGHDWACYTGTKTSATSDSGVKVSAAPTPKLSTILKFEAGSFYNDKDFIARINKAQTSWRAAPYPHLEGIRREHLLRMAGGPASKIVGRPSVAPVNRAVYEAAAKLPDNFDWRNVNGVNYVSPIRNQGQCGSCYAFASMAMNEARVRIMTNNTKQPVFSPQDIVGCSRYSQGCSGGFPYLIGGKYAEDYGLVLESEDPYKGQDGPCTTPASAARYYATKYEYIGGYYGGCNEELMRLALYENGPLAVGFEVLDDFMNYKGGIYHHTGLTRGFFPFELTNHAVLVVGYGVEKSTGEKFWITKNSWGTTWGEDGFFRIRRGNDECGFESMAVQSTPIISL
ncbi:dipeptidyl peptidase 1-like [Babylonia areolata]|uniref:dipeptidyl peptidase 1-like n=1 Tax=Babylonia areolata TaxID=304850 RepID=UPI003FD42367